MTRIVRVAIIAVTIALFLDSTLNALLGRREIAVVLALATPLGISAWGFARAGHHEAAMVMLSCVLVTVVTLILVLNPLGVHDVVITAYGGIVLVASLLLPRRTFYAITGLTLLAAGGAFALDITGHTHSEIAGHSEWSQFVIFLIVTSVFAVIGRVASEVLFGSLGAARLAAAGDSITGLPNRNGFLEQGRELLTGQGGGPGCSALILAELDGFRRLKVLVGYGAADRVVAEVARRVTALASAHLVARTGGGELAVLAVGLEDEAKAAELARELHEALEFDFSGVAVRCALGYARFPRDADTVEGLLLAAESSLLSAQSEPGGGGLAGPADRI
jgi:diguanylate cyclase (GGDEF)-like protein